MRTMLSCLFMLIAGGSFSQDQWKNVYTENAWAERDAWQKADEIIDWLSMTEGGGVADIGCHEGYMTLKLADVVGIGGRVYAIDIEASRLSKLSEHLRREGIQQVTVVKAEGDDTGLPAGPLDGVLILDGYHEMKNHAHILQRINMSLRPGGRLVICEAIAESRRTMPRDAQELKDEVDMSFVLEDLRIAEFEILFRKDRFIDREKIKGDKMWIIVATKR
jgi:precorrin-6B methylase 2